MISDEIQSGIGRDGENFWAFKTDGIEPDIITIGKGLGNGMPISAVICTEDIFDSFTQTKKFIFHTYGCHLLSVTSAIGVLDIINED